MMERLDYGARHYQDHDDYQEDQQEQYPAWYENPDEDHQGEDYAEDLQEQTERVEHQADHAADDSGESAFSDFDARFGWRSKGRRQRGRFVPPDTRGYASPVFVPVADLQARTTSGSEEERGPEA